MITVFERVNGRSNRIVFKVGGNCVKVGENFGLRVTQIANARQRIESMGA